MNVVGSDEHVFILDYFVHIHKSNYYTLFATRGILDDAGQIVFDTNFGDNRWVKVRTRFGWLDNVLIMKKNAVGSEKYIIAGKIDYLSVIFLNNLR